MHVDCGLCVFSANTVKQETIVAPAPPATERKWAPGGSLTKSDHDAAWAKYDADMRVYLEKLDHQTRLHHEREIEKVGCLFVSSFFFFFLTFRCLLGAGTEGSGDHANHWCGSIQGTAALRAGRWRAGAEKDEDRGKVATLSPSRLCSSCM